MTIQPVTFPGTLDSLEPVAAYVLEAANAAGLDRAAAYKLRLAVDEIVTNIVTYGYDSVKGDVYLNTAISATALTIEVEDTAPAYDPIGAPEPDAHVPFAERTLGGWGIYFALHNVDTFAYERVNGRNRNIFVVQRHPSAPREEHHAHR